VGAPVAGPVGEAVVGEAVGLAVVGAEVITITEATVTLPYEDSIDPNTLEGVAERVDAKVEAESMDAAKSTSKATATLPAVILVTRTSEVDTPAAVARPELKAAMKFDLKVASSKLVMSRDAKFADPKT